MQHYFRMAHAEDRHAGIELINSDGVTELVSLALPGMAALSNVPLSAASYKRAEM